MAKVNVDKLYLAPIEKDEIGDGNLIIGTPEYIEGIQQFETKLKTDTAQQFEEGRQVDQDTTITSIDVSFDLGHFSNAQYAKFLGHHIDSNGGSYSLVDDTAPYVALLYEYTKKDKGKNIKGFKILYKGQLIEPDDSVKQKEGKTDYQNHQITGSFQALKNNGLWKYTIEEDDPGCPSNIKETFFNSVIIPTAGDIDAPAITVSPTNGATGVAAGASIVFTSNKAMALSTVNTDNIFLIGPSGTQISCNITLNETAKIITLKPTSNLSAGQYTAVLTKDVKSISNVSPESFIITKFTV
ncbi:Ig-like domain-containing protein [Clostridium pasteurianum]|uniref:major tail protein n=1 Tax=Clostridium pasteurianum TaxID=1501 RepID=UPI002260C8F9|nr:major tail protein [Clostridium pasteurianum]UZW13194.1 Ig-like domain-containing protein [Clostridium pasteurianum]